MIEVHKLLLCMGYVELFLGGLSLHRNFRRITTDNDQLPLRYTKTKEQLLLMTSILFLLSLRTYFMTCKP